jgi:hypothetical protein
MLIRGKYLWTGFPSRFFLWTKGAPLKMEKWDREIQNSLFKG